MSNEDKLRNYLRRATSDLHAMHRRLAAIEEAEHEPIAVVGMACRFPGGAASPDEFWELLDAGVDTVGDFPADRGWDLDRLGLDPATHATCYSHQGGFLYDAGRFDAAFFGISPREALAMDPQQRLVLELTWETLESAGLDAARLRGSDTGVFVGAISQDYAVRPNEAPPESEGHFVTGSTTSMVAGRISYVYGFDGPTVCLDTACSSSLVAVHQAVRALRHGECGLAIAGGVTVIAAPALLTEFSRQGGLAPDGRCKSFGSGADGTGFGEGAGLVLLERLSDARRHGHDVLAVVRGSAVNSDGGSNGLTSPHGPAQRRVIRAALADAGVDADQVDAVEAHGSGTVLGDPIEANALLRTYGAARPADAPLRLGSVKSNIGHAQAAAGIAGILKMVLALRHDRLPRSLHAGNPTPHVDWSAGAVSVLNRAEPWPRTDRPRTAGVSSFGISGTNAHVLLGDPPEPPDPGEPSEPGEPSSAPRPLAGDHPVPCPLSARTPAALRAMARRLREFCVRHPAAAPVEIARACAARSALDHRAVVVAADRDDLLAGLDALAGGRDDPRVVLGAGATTTGDTAFVFPGQGSQWSGMAAELLEVSPAFAARAQQCADALAPHVDFPVLDVLRAAPGTVRADRDDVVQPALFAMMVSLAALWESLGVVPSAVVGHSQGEIAAACVAGALSLEDAARVVTRRSRLLSRISGRGGMVSVALPQFDADALAARWDGRIGVAAVNGPASTVVSGDADALDELVAACDADDVWTRRVPVDYASHSPHVEALRTELAAELDGIRPRTGGTALCSTVTTATTWGENLDADYWYENLRRPVRLDDVVRGLLDGGCATLLEVSPHPVLTTGMQETVEDVGSPAGVVGTLRRDEGGAARVVAAAGTAWVHGVPVSWSSVLGTGPRADLPTYPFEHEHYWLLPRTDTHAGEHGGTSSDTAFWSAVEDADPETVASLVSDAGTPPGAWDAVLPALREWRRAGHVRKITDAWRHRVVWRPVPAPAGDRGAGTWLLIATDIETELARHVTATLEEQGHRVHAVTVGDTASDPADMLRSAVGDRPVAGVVSLLALDTGPASDCTTLPRGLARTVELVRALAAEPAGRLWFLTRGAVPARTGENPAHPLQALHWGLARVVAAEHPELWGGVIDLDDRLDERGGRDLVAVLTGDSGEDEFALRGSTVLVRRVVHAAPGDHPGGTELSLSGTALVTGGTGALGRHVARRLADRGAEHLLLVSRRGAEAPGADTLAEELRERGATVAFAACDVADEAALAAAVDGIDPRTPLTTVVHTAAVLDDDLVTALGPEQMERVLRTKVGGALALDAVTRRHDVTAFVLFSSFAGTFGVTGQGNYAPGNAFLDAFAARRRRAGLPATSIAWGHWDGGGIAEDAVEDRLRARGITAMDPELALGVLERALADDETTLAVVDIGWDDPRAVIVPAEETPLFSELPEYRRRRAALEAGAPDPVAEPVLAARLVGLGDAEQHRLVGETVRAHVVAVLGHRAPDEVVSSRAFKDLGFDSLTAVDLRNRLRAATGLTLPTTLVFDRPTVGALTDHLHDLLRVEPAEPLDDALGTLEAAFDDADPERRRQAEARLRALVRRCTAPAAGAAGECAAPDLGDATPEEIFALLDEGLGAS